MLEDINNILNSGDVPGLYRTEDMEDILNVGKSECMKKNLQLSRMNMFGQYISRVKGNIHMVLAMSPLGEVFRSRLRMFPSLVNCCTIDWFTEWPEEALIGVGAGSIRDAELDLEEYFDSVIEMIKCVHQSVEKKSLVFLDELRRYNYVTPTSFLEMLAMYKMILSERRNYFGGQKARLEKGLNVLAEASVEIANLSEMLDKKQPELEATKIEVAQTKVTIQKENEEAEVTKAIVAKDEAVASEKEAEVSAVKNSADADLAVAEPALREAVKQVAKMDVGALYQLKATKVPLPVMVDLLQMVSLMLSMPKPKKPNASDKKAAHDPLGYFDQATKVFFNNPKKFLKDLQEFDCENQKDENVDKVVPLFGKMDPADVLKSSRDLLPVHMWIGAMLDYHKTLKLVNPKRALAAEMTAMLEVVQKNLNEKRAILKEVNDRIEYLQNKFSEMVQKEKDLNQEIEDCQKKLVRAEKMINGLAGEEVRWKETVKTLGV
jgi:dynein heavy chain